jgi:hypothetical protein
MGVFPALGPPPAHVILHLRTLHPVPRAGCSGWAQGADPSGVLFRFAEEMGFKDQLYVLSLGQGQGAKVRRLSVGEVPRRQLSLKQSAHPHPHPHCHHFLRCTWAAGGGGDVQFPVADDEMGCWLSPLACCSHW